MFKKQKPTLKAPKWLRCFFSVMETISPKLSSKIATFLFFTPIRFRPPIRELELLSKAESQTLKFKNNTVQIYKWGSSTKAVLLVHGWAGRASQVAHLVEPLMDAGFSVYSFDAPGHGNSNGKHTHIMEFSDLIHSLKKQHPEINYIIGHSIGGAACIHALKNGMAISKCILIGAPSSTTWILSSFCSTLNVSTKVEQLMKDAIETKYGKTFEELSIYNMVKNIETPGLILHCQDDIDTPVSGAKDIHKNWKNSTLVVTKDLGHRRILKNKKVAQTIVDFLNS